MAALVFESEVKQFWEIPVNGWFSVVATAMKGRRIELRLRRIPPRAANLLRQSRHEDMDYAIEDQVDNPLQFNAIYFDTRGRYQYFCLPSHIKVWYFPTYF